MQSYRIIFQFCQQNFFFITCTVTRKTPGKLEKIRNLTRDTKSMISPRNYEMRQRSLKYMGDTLAEEEGGFLGVEQGMYSGEIK